jgi:hypothetical protein
MTFTHGRASITFERVLRLFSQDGLGTRSTTITHGRPSRGVEKVLGVFGQDGVRDEASLTRQNFCRSLASSRRGQRHTGDRRKSAGGGGTSAGGWMQRDTSERRGWTIGSTSTLRRRVVQGVRCIVHGVHLNVDRNAVVIKSVVGFSERYHVGVGQVNETVGDGRRRGGRVVLASSAGSNHVVRERRVVLRGSWQIGNCRDSSLSKGNILITTIAINTNIARGLIPNPNARAGTAYLELEHSGFLEVE